MKFSLFITCTLEPSMMTSSSEKIAHSTMNRSMEAMAIRKSIFPIQLHPFIRWYYEFG